LVKDDRKPCPSPLCVTVTSMCFYADALRRKHSGDHALIRKML